MKQVQNGPSIGSGQAKEGLPRFSRNDKFTGENGVRSVLCTFIFDIVEIS